MCGKAHHLDLDGCKLAVQILAGSVPVFLQASGDPAGIHRGLIPFPFLELYLRSVPTVYDALSVRVLLTIEG